jgi:hypothetical protein
MMKFNPTPAQLGLQICGTWMDRILSPLTFRLFWSRAQAKDTADVCFLHLQFWNL